MEFVAFLHATGRQLIRRSPLKRLLLRPISLLLFACLGILLLAIPVVSQPPITLRLLMTAPEVPIWRSVMVNAFNATHPHIQLEVVEGPNAVNLLEDLYTSAFLLGNSPYDLVNMDVIWPPKFAGAGWLVDLTDQVSPKELAAFSPQDVNAGRYRDRLYRLPIRSDAGVLYYRKDLLQQAGLPLPKTYQELASIAQQLQRQGLVKWGFLWQGRQYEGAAAMFVEVMHGFGGFWIRPDSLEVGLDQPEVVNAVKFLRQTIQEGVSPPGSTTYTEEETRQIFQSGEAAFLRSWPYVWPLANAESSRIKGKIGIMPMVGTEGHEGGSCLGGWGLGIAKSSQHPKEALEAIRFLTSEVKQKQFILEAGYVPSRRVLFADREVVTKYSHYPELLNVVDRAVLRPPIAQYAQASDILQRYLSAALTDQMSPEAAMQAAADETRRLVAAAQKTSA